jgi:predicted RNA methylase
MVTMYAYIREAFTKLIEYIKTWAPRVVLVGHVKDIVLDKAGADVNAMDLDLIGKQKRITASQSDAIGYLYRKGNQNILTFKTTDEIACGARPEHLQNAEIIISEMIDGQLVTHWEKVYID